MCGLNPWYEEMEEFRLHLDSLSVMIPTSLQTESEFQQTEYMVQQIKINKILHYINGIDEIRRNLRVKSKLSTT